MIRFRGRMLSPDPVMDMGSTQGINRYSYVMNNPLIYTDPSGYINMSLDFATAYYFLMHSPHGGTWSSGGATHAFSASEAMEYVDEHNVWEETSFSINITHGGSSNFYNRKGGVDKKGIKGFISLPSINISVEKTGRLILGENNYPNSDLFQDSDEETNGDGWPIRDVRKGAANQGDGISKEEIIGLGYRYYGGDYSGSTKDNLYFIADQLNQYNPIAITWDYFSYLKNGTDRFGNPVSNFDATLSAAFIFIGGVKLEKEAWHRSIKPAILDLAGDYVGVVGRNPNIVITNGKIILEGQGPYRGKSFVTGLDFSDFLDF